MKYNVLIIVGFFCLFRVTSSIEPITGSLIAFGVVSGLVGIYYSSSCFRNECCQDKWITPNLEALEENLNRLLFGQHLVSSIVSKAVKAHLKNPNPNKALAMSFVGWTGGGKTYVSKIIAQHLYEKGINSEFVHFFHTQTHFPHENKADEYKDKLLVWIKGNVSNCERSLFIFDEADRMPIGVFDSLKPFLDYYPNIDGVNYRRSIFIFLSNSGGKQINKVAYEFWSKGRNREDISRKDLHHVINLAAFTKEGGMKNSRLISYNLIDHFIPFLPMERKHVEMCIKELKKGISPKLLDTILNDMEFDPYGLYSVTGCKLVEQKIEIWA